MIEFVVALVAVLVIGFGWWYFQNPDQAEETLEEAENEVQDEIREVGEVLSEVKQDVKDAADELEEFLERSGIEDDVREEIRDLKQTAAENWEDTAPGILIEEAVRAGERFGREFPEHVDDIEAELRDIHGELGDLTEFLRTFVNTAKASRELEEDTAELTEAPADLPEPAMKLPKEGEDRFPVVGVLENRGIETYGDLLQYKDDFTEIKGVGASYSEDIENRLREDGFDLD